MSTLTLRVPDDLDKALERQSAALGISKTDLAREALKRYLQVAEFRTLRLIAAHISRAGVCKQLFSSAAIPMAAPRMMSVVRLIC